MSLTHLQRINFINSAWNPCKELWSQPNGHGCGGLECEQYGVAESGAVYWRNFSHVALLLHLVLCSWQLHYHPGQPGSWLVFMSRPANTETRTASEVTGIGRGTGSSRMGLKKTQKYFMHCCCQGSGGETRIVIVRRDTQPTSHYCWLCGGTEREGGGRNSKRGWERKKEQEGVVHYESSRCLCLHAWVFSTFWGKSKSNCWSPLPHALTISSILFQAKSKSPVCIPKPSCLSLAQTSLCLQYFKALRSREILC